MKKHLLLLIAIALYSANSYADKYKEQTDSLYKVAQKLNTADAYLAVCASLAEQWNNEDPFKECLGKAAVLMKKGASQKTKAQYHHMAAMNYRYNKEDEKFKDEIAKAQRIYTEIKQPEDIATMYNEMGQYYLYKNMDSAYHYYDKGLAIINKKRCNITANLMHNKGIILYYKGKTDQALELFKEVGVILEEINEHDPLPTIYSSIATIYDNKEEYDSTLIYYQKAIDKCKQTGNHFNEAGIYNGITTLYAKRERFEEALEYATKSVEVAKKYPSNKGSVIMSYYARGSLLQLLKRDRESISDLLIALRLAGEQNSAQLSLKSIPALMQAYKKLGISDSARYYTLKGEECVKQMPGLTPEVLGFYSVRGKHYLDNKEYAKGLKDLLTLRYSKHTVTPSDEIYRYIAEGYAGLKEYKQAYLYMDSAAVKNDSIIKKKYDKNLSEFSVKFKTKEKELHISKLQEEQLTQKNVQLKLVITFIVCMFLTLFVILYLMYKRRMQKIHTHQLELNMAQQEQQFAALQKDTDLRLARKYIEGLENERTRLAKDLHDGVCNDLLGIQLLVKSNQNQSAELQQVSSMLDGTRKSVRSISHELMPPTFQYATIDEYLDDYIRNLPLPSGTQITYQSDKHIDWSLVSQQTSYEIYRIVQETLGNIIKHADATRIEMELKAEADSFILEIVDNGKNKNTQPFHGTGIGTFTIQDRIKSIGGEYVTTHTESTNSQRFIIKQTMYQ